MENPWINEVITDHKKLSRQYDLDQWNSLDYLVDTSTVTFTIDYNSSRGLTGATPVTYILTSIRCNRLHVYYSQVIELVSNYSG